MRWLWPLTAAAATPLLVPSPSESADPRTQCAEARLPPQVFSGPRADRVWDRQGSWETRTGGKLVAWTQTGYGEDTEVELRAGGRIIAGVHAELVTPEGKLRDVSASTVLTVTSCHGDALAEIWELPAKADEYRRGDRYEVYGPKGVLLARGEMSSRFPTRLQWTDTKDTVIAWADYKTIGDDLNVFSGVLHFQLDFATGIEAAQDHKLVVEQNRWVLAAATQLRTIRDADRAPNGEVLPGPFQFWVFTWTVLQWVLLAGSVAAAMHVIFLWVYFPEQLTVEGLLKGRRGKERVAARYDTLYLQKDLPGFRQA